MKILIIEWCFWHGNPGFNFVSTSCISLLSTYPNRRNISHCPVVLRYFSVRFLLPIYCRCRMLLLHLITLSDTHTHTHTQTHSVRLLWTRDRPVAGTSTWQHATFTRERKRHQYIHGGICVGNLSKRVAANPRLRQGDQRDRPVSFICYAVYWGWFIEILITLVFPRSFPLYTFFQFQLVYE